MVAANRWSIGSQLVSVTLDAWSSGNRPTLLIFLYSSPCGAYSSTRNTRVLSWKNVSSLKIFLCLKKKEKETSVLFSLASRHQYHKEGQGAYFKFDWMSISRRNWRTILWFSSSLLFRTFMATMYPDWRSRIKYTLPNWPLPNGRASSKSSRHHSRAGKERL